MRLKCELKCNERYVSFFLFLFSFFKCIKVHVSWRETEFYSVLKSLSLYIFPGLELGKDRGVEFTDQKTPEENGGEQACDQGPAQNLAGNILDGAKNIPRQPAN